MILDGGLPAASILPRHDVEAGERHGGLEVTSVLFMGGRRDVKPKAPAGRATLDDVRAKALALDQFYTHPEIALYFYGVLQRYCDPARYQMIEPSAGTGSFLNVMPAGSIGIDLAPRHPDIWTADFRSIRVASPRPIATLGNPPFGRNSNLAIAFLNHAAAQSDVVAFILPRTARKSSFQNRLDRRLHLIHEEIVPAEAFIFCGKPYDVPAVFQIWKRRTCLRELWPVETEHPDFEFLKDRAGAQFAIRRVGARAGVVLDELGGSPSSHHFIRAAVAGVRVALTELEPELRAAANNVAGNPSIAKSEIVALYRRYVATRPAA